jgi:hypothetical protein
MSEPEPITFDCIIEQIIQYRLSQLFRPRHEWSPDSIFAQMEAAKDLPPAALNIDDLERWLTEEGWL